MESDSHIKELFKLHAVTYRILVELAAVSWKLCKT